MSRIYLILIAILAVLTANMYAPGIPLIQASLHTSIHMIQLSISYYMLGLAVGMFIYGPISDHFGRKPLLCLSLLIYIIGLIISIASSDIQLFLVSRIIQALGAAGALSLWQAMAFDRYKEQAGKMIALGYIAIGTIPAIAPLIGSNIIHFFGWKSTFTILAIYGAILFILTMRLPCVAKQKKATTHWFTTALAHYVTIVKSPRFILLAFTSSLMYSQLYVFVAQTPSILHALHYTTQQIGMSYIPISVSFIVGGIITRTILNVNVNSNYPLIIGMLLYIIGMVLQITFQASVSSFNIFELIIPFTIVTSGTGMMLPVIVSRAMQLYMHISGSSAAFMGGVQNLMAFLLSGAAAYLSHLGVLGLTISLSIIIVVTLVLCGISLAAKEL